MAVAIQEIMNHEVFSVGATDLAEHALKHLLMLSITGAPVLEGDGRPVGFVSIRDLAGAPSGARVGSRMSVPVESIGQDLTIRAAAERMAATSRHHLVVVDEGGRAVGVVGALDVVRGLLGRPVPHPDAFPHFDPRTGSVWSDDEQLSFGAADRSPEGPGVIVLIEAEVGRANRVVWSQGTDNIRGTLRELLSRPALGPGHLVNAALCGRLWFRCTATATTPALPSGRTDAR